MIPVALLFLRRSAGTHPDRAHEYAIKDGVLGGAQYPREERAQRVENQHTATEPQAPPSQPQAAAGPGELPPEPGRVHAATTSAQVRRVDDD